MIAPFSLTGPLSGLVLGAGFGLALEGAGFGNPDVLTGQLRLSNWAVFKTMFTAIIVSASLLYAAAFMGYISLSDIFIPSVYFWGTLLGGMGVGIGFAVGGYCPGTSIVGCVSGRFDALTFLLGIGLGTLGFNLVYPLIGTTIYAQSGQTSLTVQQLTHLPVPVVLLLLFAVLVGVGRLVSKPPGPPKSASKTMGINKSAMRGMKV